MEANELTYRENGPARYSDVSPDVWARADRDGRYLLRIYAAVLSSRSRPVLRHLSAARVWGLPILGPWPRAVHVQGGSRMAPRATPALTWHQDELPESDIAEVGGILTTTRLRTMVDLARSQPFRSAVISLDAALQQRFVLPSGAIVPTVPKGRLLDRVYALPAGRDRTHAREAADFADCRAGTSGQSLSRAGMHLAGLPIPELRAVCPHPAGQESVDFRWDERFHVKRRPLVGDFDCEVYPDDPARDDRLRGQGHVVARWLWADAVQPSRLRALLLDAGLRPNS